MKSAYEKLQSPSKIIDLTNESASGIIMVSNLEDKHRKNLGISSNNQPVASKKL